MFLFLATLVSSEKASGKFSEKVTWVISDDNVLTISGEGEATNDNENSPFKDINETITSIVVEDGVTYIGKCLFNGLDEVKKVVLGKDIKKIGVAAFEGMSNLETIDYQGDNEITVDGDGSIYGDDQEDMETKVKIVLTEAYKKEHGTNFAGVDTTKYVSSQTPAPAQTTEEDDGLSGGAIAGIVIAVVVVVAIVAALLYFFVFKKKTNEEVDLEDVNEA